MRGDCCRHAAAAAAPAPLGGLLLSPHQLSPSLAPLSSAGGSCEPQRSWVTLTSRRQPAACKRPCRTWRTCQRLLLTSWRPMQHTPV